MQAVDPVAKVLSELISNQYVTRSSIGARSRSALESLFQAGALREVRSGAGWHIVVSNLEAVKEYASANYPNGLEVDIENLNRAESVAFLRNAKRGSNLSGEPVLIKGFSSAHLVTQVEKIDIYHLTELCGVASFLLSDNALLRYEGNRVALVENLEPFLQFEGRFRDFDAAIYYAGRMSERFLKWLESQDFDIVLFCDYDPVGLQEYIKLKKLFGHRSTLFIPENLRYLVERYGKAALLRDSTAVLSSLRQVDDEMVLDILQCLEDFGAGLEQEILWANLRGQ